MNYDIRNICMYYPKIHSRYYIDTNGIVYTSLSKITNKIMIDGVRKNITSIKKTLLNDLNKTTKLICEIPNFPNYYILYNWLRILYQIQN